MYAVLCEGDPGRESRELVAWSMTDAACSHHTLFANAGQTSIDS